MSRKSDLIDERESEMFISLGFIMLINFNENARRARLGVRSLSSLITDRIEASVRASAVVDGT